MRSAREFMVGLVALGGLALALAGPPAHDFSPGRFRLQAPFSGGIPEVASEGLLDNEEVLELDRALFTIRGGEWAAARQQWLDHTFYWTEEEPDTGIESVLNYDDISRQNILTKVSGQLIAAVFGTEVSESLLVRTQYQADGTYLVDFRDGGSGVSFSIPVDQVFLIRGGLLADMAIDVQPGPRPQQGHSSLLERFTNLGMTIEVRARRPSRAAYFGRLLIRGTTFTPRFMGEVTDQIPESVFFGISAGRDIALPITR